MPLFSVVIPLYNKQNHILDTVQTVLNQTFTSFEIIIIDDGSTDDSLAKVQSIKHPSIQVFHQTNKGVAAARNYGMKRAEGNYIAFLDADDVWMPNHLEELQRLINNHPNCGLYCTNYHFDYGNDFIVNTQFPELPSDPNWEGIVPHFFKASLTHRIAWTSAVAIKKEVTDSVGYFDESITLGPGEDTDYWSRIALKFPVAFTKKVSAIYKLSASNRITNIHPEHKSYMRFEHFLEAEKKNKFLKRFNDLHRADFAIKHKMCGLTDGYQYYRKDLDLNNLPFKTRLFLQCPSIILKPLWLFKQWLKTKKIDF